MNEPTEEMILAGCEKWVERDPENHYAIFAADVREMYKAMRALEPLPINEPYYMSNC